MNKELQIKKEYDNLYVRKNGFSEDFQVEKNRDDTFNPPLMEGKNYKNGSRQTMRKHVLLVSVMTEEFSRKMR